MPWTDDRVETLKTLWTDGLSASQVAAVLGGVSRNGVIGKVHRLGLPRRKEPTRKIRVHHPKPRRPRVLTPSINPPIVAVRAIMEMPDLEPVKREDGTTYGVLTLPKSGRCRWPCGDPLDETFAFCARKSDGTYCRHHTVLAWKPVKKRARHASEQSRADRARYRDSARWAGL